MDTEIHRLRHQELMRQADQYRFAREVMKTKHGFPSHRVRQASTESPARCVGCDHFSTDGAGLRTGVGRERHATAPAPLDRDSPGASSPAACQARSWLGRTVAPSAAADTATTRSQMAPATANAAST